MNVVNLFNKGFFLCPNCLEETDIHLLVDSNKDGTFISGFVCAGPKCPDKGTYWSVVNGYIKEKPHDHE